MDILCKNCKKHNPPTALSCAYCKAPLLGSLGIGHSQAVVENREEDCGNCGKPTPVAEPVCVHCGIDRAPAGIQPDEPAAVMQPMLQASIGCMACGYPNLASADNCMQCGSQLHRQREPKPAAMIAPVAPLLPPQKIDSAPAPEKVPVVVSPSVAQEMSAAKTVPFWELLASTKAQSFSLTPLPRPGEQPPESRQFFGEVVSLSRDNLEPDNISLTSKVQASLHFVDGSWLLSDESGQQSTFLRISRPQPLQDGDVLLLGNRLFRFTTQDAGR
jgi:hypothetical protein